MSVNSNPFFTVRRWIWFGRSEKPTTASESLVYNGLLLLSLDIDMLSPPRDKYRSLASELEVKTEFPPELDPLKELEGFSRKYKSRWALSCQKKWDRLNTLSQK